MHSEEKQFTAPTQKDRVQVKGVAEIEGLVAYGLRSANILPKI